MILTESTLRFLKMTRRRHPKLRMLKHASVFLHIQNVSASVGWEHVHGAASKRYSKKIINFVFPAACQALNNLINKLLNVNFHDCVTFLN